MSSHEPAQPAASDPDQRIVYKTIADIQLPLDVFTPDDSPRTDAVPGIVFFHGGGWNGGSPEQFHPQCRYLAARGMVAMSAQYRVRDVHGTTPYECVQDGKSAVRWIRQHAARFGIDPARLAAGGGSAGAHVATACATLREFDEPGEDRSISARPDALVLMNPVFDNGPGGFGHDRVKDRWQAFSPLHNVSPGAPPTIVCLGSEDGLIPVSTAEQFKQRMTAADSRCDVWIYKDQPHGFFNYFDGSNPCYNATVHQLDRFLASLGYLTGEPAMANEDIEATCL